MCFHSQSTTSNIFYIPPLLVAENVGILCNTPSHILERNVTRSNKDIHGNPNGDKN